MIDHVPSHSDGPPVATEKGGGKVAVLGCL